MLILDSTKIPSVIHQVIKDLNSSGFEAYIVGGCVRDLLIGVNPHDYDICTNATPSDIIKVAKKNSYKYSAVGIDYGTVVLIINGEEIEVTTYRHDGTYSDGRHPDEIQFATSLEEDLKRRDFTINAIAFNPITHDIVDKFNGIEDLSRGIIKTIQEPNTSFSDDALRLLRAIRFAIKYKFFIDNDTAKAIISNAHLIEYVSKERITQEFEKILGTQNSIRNTFMEYHELIFTIIPELRNCYKFNQNNKYHQHDVYEHMLYVVDGCKTNKFEIKMAALLHDIGKPSSYTEDEQGHGHFYGHPEVSYEISKEILSKHFRLTNKQYDRITELIRNHDMMMTPTEKNVRRALNNFGEDFLRDWFILKQSDFDDHVIPESKVDWFVDTSILCGIMQNILDKQACFSIKDLNINGNDIIDILKIKPSKHIGIILNTLLKDVMDDKVNNDYDELSKRTIEIYNSIQ